MADTPIIVDAESAPVSPSNLQSQSVPVKIDTTAMQNMLQSIARQAAAGQIPGAENADEKINPSLFIKNMSLDMESLYARFDKLKILATELNGMSVADPLPEAVTLKSIDINFAVTKNGETTEHTATVHNVASVGELTSLLSTEFGVIISSLQEQAVQIEDLAKRTAERCGAAMKEWEEKNKDKQIVRAGEQNPGAATVTATTTAAPAAG